MDTSRAIILVIALAALAWGLYRALVPAKRRAQPQTPEPAPPLERDRPSEEPAATSTPAPPEPKREAPISTPAAKIETNGGAGRTPITTGSPPPDPRLPASEMLTQEEQEDEDIT